MIKKLRNAIGRLTDRHHAIKAQVRQELAAGEPELQLLPLLADRERSFVDVGANQGVYAYLARDYFARVYAIEAHPGLTAQLRRDLGPGASVLPLALSDQEGSADLWVPHQGRRDVITRSSLQADANPGFAQRRVTVPLTTLDALAIADPAVIKIDVEGHELAVLNGAAETLARAKPVCIVEIEERHNVGGVARTFAALAALGYDAYFLHRGALRAGREFDPAALQGLAQAKSVGGPRSPDYVNNFLFIHRADAAALERLRGRFG